MMSADVMCTYLNTVLQAVELSPNISPVPDRICTNAPLFVRITWKVVKLTSQQELAIWQPAWPTVRVILSV